MIRGASPLPQNCASPKSICPFRFIKGKLSFSKTGLPTFEILKGQESFRISPFTKTNAWGVLPESKSIFKKGDLVECYSPSGVNEILI